MKSKKMLGNALLFLTAFVWGTAFVFQRVGMESIEPFTFGAARMVPAALMVGIVGLILLKNDKSLASMGAEEKAEYKKNTIKGGVCCGLCLTAASSFQQVGIVYTTAGKAGFITAMYMLLVPVIGFVFLKKKVQPIVWLAVLMGVAGMYFLCMTEGFKLTKGDTLVAICALCFALHILCCDHFAGKGNAVLISAIQFAVVSVISWILAFLFEEPTIAKIVSAAFPIFFCGVLSAGMGYTLQIVAQQFTDPTIASLLMSLESVFAVLSGAVLLHEVMSGREILGCVIMFAAIVLVQIPIPERKKK